MNIGDFMVAGEQFSPTSIDINLEMQSTDGGLLQLPLEPAFWTCAVIIRCADAMRLSLSKSVCEDLVGRSLEILEHSEHSF